MITNDFPTAEAVRQLAAERASINHDNALRHLLENVIEPAIRNGATYCEVNSWDGLVNDSVKETLESKGYVVVDRADRFGRGTVVIAWGEIPAELVAEEEESAQVEE